MNWIISKFRTPIYQKTPLRQRDGNGQRRGDFHYTGFQHWPWGQICKELQINEEEKTISIKQGNVFE